MSLTWFRIAVIFYNVSFPERRRINTGAYTTPFSNAGVEFYPLGMAPDASGFVLHESGYLRRNGPWNYPNMFSPFWRLIYDEQEGHRILTDQREWTMGPDSVVLVPPHFRCDFRGDRPVPTLWLHFSLARHPMTQKHLPLAVVPELLELEIMTSLKPLFGSRKKEQQNRARIAALSLALLHVVLSRPELRWLEDTPDGLLRVTRLFQPDLQGYHQPITGLVSQKAHRDDALTEGGPSAGGFSGGRGADCRGLASRSGKSPYRGSFCSM